MKVKKINFINFVNSKSLVREVTRPGIQRESEQTFKRLKVLDQSHR